MPMLRHAATWALALLAGGLLAAAVPATGPAEQHAVADTDEQRIADLIAADHILAARGIIDGRGHASVRSIRNPSHYFMARIVPPGEVTRADIVEFDADSRPVDQTHAQVFSERLIHGEIYRMRADVQSVVHCHPVEVLPFTVTAAPLKAVMHTAYFLGTEAAPVFDLADAEGPDNRMLVTTIASGAALARKLGARSVVLMRGHGMAVAAPSVRDAVYRSIYTIQDAQVEAEALRLGTPKFLTSLEAQRTEWVDPLWAIWKSQTEKSAPVVQ